MNVLDFETAQNVLGGLPAAIVGVVLSGFELDVRRLTCNMQKATQTGDVVAYRAAAQALADAAGNLGAFHLADMARKAVHHEVPSADCALLAAGESAIGAIRSAYASPNSAFRLPEAAPQHPYQT